jgi:hypothetical protein
MFGHVDQRANSKRRLFGRHLQGASTNAVTQG